MKLPLNSPLDSYMWSPGSINNAWNRIDSLEPEGLKQMSNVREWLESSPERNDSFVELVANVRQDLAAWSATGLGILPSGVGGLTLAVERHGVLGVGKWISETTELDARVTMTAVLSAAGLGPQLLEQSENGFLIAKVDPGIPLRSLEPSLTYLQRAAEMLPALRALHIPKGIALPVASDKIAQEIDQSATEADSDGFKSRAHAFALRAHQATADLPTKLGHGDFQLGNVLMSGSSELALIDATGTLDAGYADAARLAVHTLADAIGNSVFWKIDGYVDQMSDWTALDADLLRLCMCAQASYSAWVIKRQVPSRVWEWSALDSIAHELSA